MPPRMGTLWGIVALLLVGTVGCFSAQSASEQAGDERVDASPAAQSAGHPVGPRLAAPDPSIRTIQLYAGGDERRPPILPLRNDRQPLTLEFDLMAATGRPLSIHFYHADRNWERDLSPAEYMVSFQDDNLLEYTPSRGTGVAYTHYRYQFPNNNIRFRVSGNYILRVTEQGQRERVLFEQPFFVTEQAGPVALRIDDIPVSGQRSPSDLPAAQFTPPPDLRGTPFQYTTCFVRNGRLGTARCTDRPRLTQQPALTFDLYRDRAFAPTTADYVLDLRAIRPGGAIEGTDRTVTPYRVLLEPDYAQFPGRMATTRPLDGQIVVDDAVRTVGVPDVEAEYARVQFSFVPPNEQPLQRALMLDGTFRRATRMQWRPERGRYEADVLLKQGLYDYYYHSDDPALQTVLRRSLPVARDRYTAFVYYADRTLNTDRLVAVQTAQAP